MKKEVKKYTITKLTEFCNQTFGTKKNGKPFTISDVKGYIKRGAFPKSLGGKKIVLCDKYDLHEIETSVKYYKIKG